MTQAANGANVADATQAIDQSGGSAAIQGDLWGERARDWAEVMEGWNGWGVPLYRQVMERLDVGPGTDLLDVGCGAGRFCRIIKAVRSAGEQPVRDALAAGVRALMTTSGGVRIEDEYRYLIATG